MFKEYFWQFFGMFNRLTEASDETAQEQADNDFFNAQDLLDMISDPSEEPEN